MKCPDCDHNGEVYIHVRAGARLVKCIRCKGKSVISEEEAGWIETGNKMRDARVNGVPYRSLYEEAARRGITAPELSKMEAGRIKPIVV